MCGGGGFSQAKRRLWSDKTQIVSTSRFYRAKIHVYQTLKNIPDSLAVFDWWLRGGEGKKKLEENGGIS